MTKDWDAVQMQIRDLSIVQKMRLEEVRKVMDERFGFRASVRAYRMKLAEWSYTKSRGMKRGASGEGEVRDEREGSGKRRKGNDGGYAGESDSTIGATPSQQSGTEGAVNGTPGDPQRLETELLDGETVTSTCNDVGMVAYKSNVDEVAVMSTNFPTPFTTHYNTPDPWIPVAVAETDPVMDMLAAVLDADSQKLEEIIIKHPQDINLPIGLPFDIPGSRFYNHPAMAECAVLQHPNQTLLDIACALPCGPVTWILWSHNAKGSKDPFGTDLAFRNAIKNGRTYTVQALLMPGRSNIHGEAETAWKPILQAVYWNQPEVVRLLIDRGARVNETAPWVNGVLMSPLQHCLERRWKSFANKIAMEKCHKILKILLNAGADIHCLTSESGLPTPFESFIKPWQGDPNWATSLSSTEIECLEAFIRKGADTNTTFKAFQCSAPSTNTFQHQVLWHTIPKISRILIDNATPSPIGNGSTLLHDIVGTCPDAKRHPSDTLRDMTVLIKRGADPNLGDHSGQTPLQTCITHCPVVDIVDRIKILLDHGADPEIISAGNKLPPYLLAARIFSEPQRSQIMHALVEKIRGRKPRVVYGETFTWDSCYFPIPDTPSWEHVQEYSTPNGGFEYNLAQMVPEDVRKVFQRAAFGVASTRFLDSVTQIAKASFPLDISASSKNDVFQALKERRREGLDEYRFDQDFVLGLLTSQFGSMVSTNANTNPAGNRDEDIILAHQTPILSLIPPTTTITTNPITIPTSNPNPQSPQPHSPHSASSSASPVIISTTQIRWPRIGEPLRHTDLKKSKEAVLVDSCKECGNGVMLTKDEMGRHDVEHEHCRGCRDEGCKRRFCVRGKKRLGEREGKGESVGVVREFRFRVGEE